MHPITITFVAFLGVFVLSSLFAFFIATRGLHWFGRIALLIFSVLPILMVDASDLMLILLISQLTIFAGVFYEEARKNAAQANATDPNRLLFIPRFKLFDLMLVFVAVCAIFALLIQAAPFKFLESSHLIGIGTAVGVWSLMAFSLNYWKFPWRKKAALGMIAMAVSLIWAALDDQWLYPGSNWVAKLVSWLLFLIVICSVIVLMMKMYDYLRPLRSKPEATQPPVSRLRQTLQYSTFVILLLIFVSFAGSILYCYLILLNPPVPGETVQKNGQGEPNGFDELVEAGKEFNKSPILSTSRILNPGKVTRDEVAAFASSFKKIDSGLSRKNQTCIDLTSINPENDIRNLGNGIENNIQQMRSVARALSVKARQEIHDGYYDEALRDGLRCMQIAESLHECILMTHLVGITCEDIGAHAIQSSISQATTSELKQAAKILRKIVDRTPSLESIFANDQFYVWKLFDWKERIFYRIYEPSLMAPARSQIQTARARRDTYIAQLRVAIALELHKRDRGNYPRDLSELVPGYLDKIPGDPFPLDSPGKALRYSIDKNQNKFKLYSVGPNGTDEGGEISPSGNWHGEGDMNFVEIVQQDEIETRELADRTEEQLDK